MQTTRELKAQENGVDLRIRAKGPELMDAPDVDITELRMAMSHLEVINRLLNSHRATLNALEKLLPRGCAEFSLLDAGCGSGDTLRRVADWARRRELRAHLDGIELCADTAACAAEKCVAYPEITIRHADLFELPPMKYDVVHCALMLHHFPEDDEVSRVLGHMLSLARRGIIANDLHRHWFAYHSIKVLTRLGSGSRILRNDAPLSVARGFARTELEEIAAAAGLRAYEMKWCWAFRWLLWVRCSEPGGEGRS